ncbi:MAG TPA: DUF402 domain-containing protein [Anaerolineales bacterium]|nr:DUF402 domain-containing protein [Anaerolineales bacterium]
MNQPGDEVTVRKLDAAGREKWSWHAVVRTATATSLHVEARFNAPEAERFGLEFRRGDRILESYFADRWYNIFAVYGAAQGDFKGWYCNISRPAHLEDGEVIWVDLELDVVVRPDHRSAVLDEEEFAGLLISENERVAARRAVDELLRHARAASGPFASPGAEDPTQA